MHRLTLLLTCTTVVTALTLPIPTLNSTLNTQNITTSFVDLPILRGHCVNDSLFSGWDGAINNNDCFVAQNELELRVRAILRKQYTFWSKEFNASPPSHGSELPLLAHYNTCVLLIQITKEFGDRVVPFYQGGYLPTGRLPTTVKSTWEMVLGAITAVRQQCLKSQGQPGWADISGAGGTKAAIVLAFPANSEMARDWALSTEKGMGKGNMVDETAVS